MGNCCTRMISTKSFKETLEFDFIEVKYKNKANEALKNLTPEISPENFTIKSLFNDSEIIRLMNLFFEEMQEYKPKCQLLSKIVKDGKTCEFFGMNLPKKDSPELLIVVIYDYTLAFSADFFTFCLLNQQIKITDSFIEDEILQVETYEDTIYILNRLKTEKVLLVASRNILILRIIRKLDENRFLDLSQTVDVTCLMENKKIKDMFESLKENFATTFISGAFIENKNGFCRVTSYARSDFRSSVKMSFVKYFLNKNFESVMNNTLKNLNQIYETESWKQKKEFYWFENLSGEFLKPAFFLQKELAKFNKIKGDEIEKDLNTVNEQTREINTVLGG